MCIYISEDTARMSVESSSRNQHWYVIVKLTADRHKNSVENESGTVSTLIISTYETLLTQSLLTRELTPVQ